MIFLGETTSGLDSTAATHLVDTLRALVDAGKTVVAVIHQPSQHVFRQFDDKLLVAEGSECTTALAPTCAACELERVLGRARMEPAKHILDCITRSPIDRESDQDVDERMDQIAAAAAVVPTEPP